MTQHQPSTISESILYETEDVLGYNMIILDVLDTGTGTNRIEKEYLSDAVCLDEFMCNMNNDRLLGRRHNKTRNISMAYYYQNVLDSPPTNE